MEEATYSLLEGRQHLLSSKSAILPSSRATALQSFKREAAGLGVFAGGALKCGEPRRLQHSPMQPLQLSSVENCLANDIFEVEQEGK